MNLSDFLLLDQRLCKWKLLLAESGISRLLLKLERILELLSELEVLFLLVEGLLKFGVVGIELNWSLERQLLFD